jgi:hypothetical protein
MVKLLSFACGVIFGVVLTCAACSQVKAVSSGTPAPPPESTGYYGGPPPLGHPEISQAINDLQHARYVLQVKAASDYHGHKANAIGYIDDAVKELQICRTIQ